jgi:hypothetical protein
LGFGGVGGAPGALPPGSAPVYSFEQYNNVYINPDNWSSKWNTIYVFLIYYKYSKIPTGLVGILLYL